jgi:asparagine synthase (glutamine-hydrolysing)
MCGIAGILSNTSEELDIKPMLEVLSHRGPDDSGIWKDQNSGIILGHRRLSIIDLSPSGHQPMSYADGRFWIVFNGEIYNYKDLREELQKKGFSFKTTSDTEVVIAAFTYWGVNSLKRLRGMFAFALWDKKDQSLYLVRDRIGIKPLLWTESNGEIIFASEIKSIMASGKVARVIEPQSILDLLATGSVCQPRTMLQGVKMLDPGTCLIIKKGGIKKFISFWNGVDEAAVLRPELAGLSYRECVKLTRQKLEEATRFHLIADVPIGSFLSGGIDSTAVTALMAMNTSERVRSFTIGFESSLELKHELEPARLAAEKFNCIHTEVILSGKDVEESFEDMVLSMDQPSYDGANTYFVSRATSSAVKVALSGLGGDELFAGYPHFATLQKADRINQNICGRTLAIIHKIRPNKYTEAAFTRNYPISTRYANLRRCMSDKSLIYSLSDSLKKVFNPAFLEDYISPFIIESQEIHSRTTYIESRHYLRNTLLRDADVMSMAHGLEIRPVLLDHKLMEHALALPDSAKIRNGIRKSVLIDSVKDLLPKTLLTRPKTGFELPTNVWLTTNLKYRVVACLDSEILNQIFNKRFISYLKKSFKNNQELRLIWTLVVLHEWLIKNQYQVPYII